MKAVKAATVRGPQRAFRVLACIEGIFTNGFDHIMWVPQTRD